MASLTETSKIHFSIHNCIWLFKMRIRYDKKKNRQNIVVKTDIDFYKL